MTPDHPTNHQGLEERAQQGTKLREIRETRGLRQRDLAEAIGVGENMVGHWENGRSSISRARAVAIAKVLQVRASEFMGPDWVDLDIAPMSQDEIQQLAQADHTVFVQRRLEAHSDALRRVEATLADLEDRLAGIAGALMPLVTEHLRAAADRRQSEEGPPGRSERRATGGRRRSDQRTPGGG